MIKKLLIGASALALTASAAHAQAYFGKDDAQTVDGKILTVSGGGSTNNSSITQTDNNNTAVVNQAGGNRNSSVVEQSGNVTKDGSYAKVTQSSTGSQKTGANSSTVIQIGTDRENLGFRLGTYPVPSLPADAGQAVIINQTNTGNSSSAANRNDAVVLQGSAGAGGFANRAEVKQRGTGNDAGIQQGANAFPGGVEEDGRMNAVIDQDGTRNTAEIVQGEMDDAKTTLLRHRDRQPSLGNCVHCRGQQWNVERDARGEPGLQVDVVRYDVGERGNQQDVVERQRLPGGTHSVSPMRKNGLYPRPRPPRTL